MLTTAPRLHIRRPSPTTAEFTVTTLPPPTITLRILRTLLLILRIGLAITTALLLQARWLQSPFASPLDSYMKPPSSWLSEYALWHVLALIHQSPLGALLARASLAIPLAALIPGATVLFYVLSLRVYSSESLLVLRGLGVQTSGSPRTYLTSAPTRFIPTEKIQDIFVNEAFRGFEVRYYLVVVVEGEEDVVVVFPGLLPRRHIVETVWRGARECLYEKGERTG